MSDAIYDDVIRSEEMMRDRVEMTVDIYESADSVRDHDFTTKTNTNKPPPHQQTGSDSVKIRNYRAAVVCLVLLCVLLLTAVIVLCVHIYTNNTNYTKLTEQKKEELINQLGKTDQWIYYQFSFYYMSNETKNWTESRQDCLKKEADLIIINSSEEQDFVKNNTVNREFWIGVNDSDVEGIWKWVDGSNLTSGFWASREPNGGTKENCAVTYLTQWPKLIGWLDVKCNDAYQWICEKSILPLIR